MTNPIRRALISSLVALAAAASTVIVATSGHLVANTDPGAWVGTWAAAQHGPATSGLTAEGFDNQTLRMTVHTSIGGDQARIRLSNMFGTTPLTIGHATIGRPVAHTSAAIDSATLREVRFTGRSSVTILPGTEVISDAIDFAVPALGDVSVSLWLPVATGPVTHHTVSRSTTYMTTGDVAGDPAAGDLEKVTVPNPIPGAIDSPWFFLAGLDVLSHHTDRSVAVFGDSISDGFGSTDDTDHRWPDILSQRLAELPEDRHAPGVLNVALSGNSYSHASAIVPQIGPSALSRMPRDVLSQTGVHTVILQVGINDILIYKDGPDRIVQGIRQVAARAHAAGLRILIFTLGPWRGYPGWTPDLDVTRQTVNDFIRSTRDADAVVDADALLRDPTDAGQLTPRFDSGDHLHPNDTANARIAGAVPLEELLR